jgi:integrase
MSRKPARFRACGVTFYPPGARGANVGFVARGTFDGHPFEITLKAVDRKAAEREWIEKRIAYEARRAERGVAVQEVVTFADAADRYVQARRPRRDDIAVIRRIQDDRFGALEIERIVQNDIDEMARRLYPTAKASTRNRSVYVPVAAVLHYAAANRWCGYIRVSKEKEAAVAPRSVSPDVASALIATAEGDLADLLLWLFRQGWRVTDSISLTWERIDLKRGLAVYHVAKTDEWLTAPLHQAVIEMLERRRRAFGGDRVFPYRDRHEVYDALEPLCKTLGVHFTPHMARHTFATMLRNDGVELDEVRDAGAWKDIKSVLRYGRVSVDKVRQSINRLK